MGQFQFLYNMLTQQHNKCVCMSMPFGPVCTYFLSMSLTRRHLCRRKNAEQLKSKLTKCANYAVKCGNACEISIQMRCISSHTNAWSIIS